MKDVTVSLPRLVGGTGVQQTFPLPLNGQEQSSFKSSAAVIRQVIDDLEQWR